MNEDFTEVRNGLTNYVFSCLQGMPYSGVQAKHALVSILAEEALKISKDSEGNVEMFAIKPLLRAVIVIFNERIECLKKVQTSEIVKVQINDYEDIVNKISNLIENIK